MRQIITLVVAALVFAGLVMVIGVFKDPWEPFKKLGTTPKQEVEAKVKTEVDPRFLTLSIWHPSFGANAKDTMAMIGHTVINFSARSGKNLETIFEQGLAEIPDSMVAKGKFLWRETWYVEQWEVRRYGKLNYAQAIALRLLDGTYEFPEKIASFLKQCTPVKFVRARKGTLIKMDVGGGEDTLRAGIRAEFGEPILTLEGTEFYGRCK